MRQGLPVLHSAALSVYVDALIQTAQDRHRAVNREPSDRVPNPGEIGGGNACQFRSLADRQALAV
jgi:hypothetical protein